MKEKQFLAKINLIMTVIFLLILWNKGAAWSQGWPDIKVRLLSDECFAAIEMDVGTRIRHCPHHDLNGRIDEEQLVYVLGTLDQESWLNPKLKKVAEKHLEKHYDRLREKILKKGIERPVNINKAQLTELVALPQIGPVLAVRIIEYRNAHNLYFTIADITKVDGIGLGIFNAVRHYISTN